MLAAEAMPMATKLLFIAVGLGLIAPAVWNVIRSTTRTPRSFQERRYDRTRNRKPKPVSERRYRRLWVVDDDSGVDAARKVERQEDHR